MIRSLRQRHRLTFYFLAVFLPLFFGLGLMGRQVVPTQEPLPPALATFTVPTGVLAQDDLWEGLRITTWAFAGPDELVLILSPNQVLPYPDLLVYWIPKTVAVTVGDQLPASARLLGPLQAPAGNRWSISLGWAEETANLVLYSLAQRQIVSQAELPKLR